MFTFLFSLLSNQDVHVWVTAQEAEFVYTLKQYVVSVCAYPVFYFCKSVDLRKS